ncbi:hypothetical protein AB1Y20_009051 [Prymnesium parvum]|uniref:DNA2/NAM7 helicase helicase domain-containing protein n=1 Tax=Prymnesium parvum TaxID=97485 RepID=A0AB34K4K3_PRYPA
MINQVCRDGRLQDLHNTRLAVDAAGWVVKAVRSNAQDMPREGKLGPLIRVFQLRRAAEADVLSKADVVVCTCSTAAESRIVTRAFHYLLVDEAAQALEPEVLIPLTAPVFSTPC